MNEIIREMKCMETLMGLASILRPIYFYIQAYGKELKDELKTLAELMGQTRYLVFDRMSLSGNQSYISSLEALLDKHKPLGQHYEGCILVDFTGWEDMEQIADFVAYLSQCQGHQYLFTMKDSMDTVLIQQVLEQYFFVRPIRAELYTIEEQYAAIKEEIERCQIEQIKITMKRGTDKLIRSRLERCDWKPDQSVLFRLKNAVDGAIYDALLRTGSTQVVMDEELVNQMFRQLQEKQEDKIKIGFVVGGMEHE